jgi:hypothetical protein
MAYGVRPIAMPSDLSGVGNGTLPAALLTGVPGGGALHHLAARAWTAMVATAAAEGVTLQQTSGPDLFRSLAQQTALFTTRYTLTPQPGRPTKSWQGRTWWLRPNMAPSAVPGTSNHGWGLAADTCTSLHGTVYSLAPNGTGVGRRAWDWLIANYERFGWSHEYTSPNVEPWHIRYVAGDNLPAAVLAYERPPTFPPPTPIPAEDDDMRVIQFEWAGARSRPYAVGALEARAIPGVIDGVDCLPSALLAAGQSAPIVWASPAARALTLRGFPHAEGDLVLLPQHFGGHVL